MLKAARSTIGPAFSAYQSVAQTVNATTDAKLQFQTKEFDTDNAFDSTTNYRFQPAVPGYYHVTGGLKVDTATTEIYLTLRKNGAGAKRLSHVVGGTGQAYGSALIYLNGTTDYIELWVYMNATNTIDASAAGTYFQAAMVRPA